MSAHAIALTIHIAAGSSALVVGPFAAFAAKRRGLHTRLGTFYYWAFVVIFASAVVLAALNWDDAWWLALVGAFSYSFALVGYLAAKRRRRGWLLWHVSGQGGSYIAMTTAVLVVNFGTASAIAWIAPTLIGSPLIAWVNTQIAKGKRPKSRPDLAGSPAAG